MESNTRIYFILMLLLLTVSRSVLAKERPVGTAPTDNECLTSIGAAHLPRGMPVQLVRAIATVEAGRLDAATRRVSPWPWTINVNGQGYFYRSKAQAVAAVLVLQEAGIPSVDVGCMQVNLIYHPHAFASLDEAFNPSANVAYAARFLNDLFHQTGSWPAAAAAYHSQTAQIGAEYAKRVMALYPMKGGQAAKPVEVAEMVNLPGPTPEMLRLQRESRQDHDRLRVMFGPPASDDAPALKRARSARPARRATAATRVTDTTQKKLLLLADRSWLDGASTN